VRHVCDVSGTRFGLREGLASSTAAEPLPPAEVVHAGLRLLLPHPVHWLDDAASTAPGEELALEYQVVVHGGDAAEAGSRALREVAEERPARRPGLSPEAWLLLEQEGPAVFPEASSGPLHADRDLEDDAAEGRFELRSWVIASRKSAASIEGLGVVGHHDAASRMRARTRSRSFLFRELRRP